MEHTITAFAPSKTFNVAGLCQSYVVIPNKKLYNAYDATYNAFDLGDNVFGMTASGHLKEHICCGLIVQNLIWKMTN